jgi:hypothetical protein
MATHAFAAYSIRVSPWREPDNFIDLSNLDGHGADILYLIHGFLRAIFDEPLTDESLKQYLSMSAIEPAGRCIRFTGRYGPYDQPGNRVVDIRSHKSVHDLTKDDAFTTDVRNLVVIPESGTTGFFLTERYSGRGIASIFMRELHKAFRAKFSNDKPILHFEGLTNGEAWERFLSDARLTQVRVIRHRLSPDIADENLGKSIYNVSYTATPIRGAKFFPRALQDALIQRTIDPHTILGLSPDTPFDETRLQMDAGDQQKEFMMEHDRPPVLVYALDPGEDDRPTDDRVYEQMAKVTNELCQGLGVELASNWQEGGWSQEALAVPLEVIRGS